MARPQKLNADYFAHDANMRNGKSARALRRRYGNEGYAIWCYLLEELTAAPHFRIPISDVFLDIMAADADVEISLLSSIIDYCCYLNLLNKTDDNVLYSESLDEKFAPLIDRRANDKARKSEKRDSCNNIIFQGKTEENATENSQINSFPAENPAETRENDHFLAENVAKTVENPAETSDNPGFRMENTHSKVKKSKVKKSKEYIATNVALSTHVDDTLKAAPENNEFAVIQNTDNKPKVEDIDFDAMLKFFNSTMDEADAAISRITKIQGQRRNAVKARIHEYGKTEVANAIRKAAISDFLNGRTDKPFVANFDWIFKPNNFPKVLEGNYDNRKLQTIITNQASQSALTQTNTITNHGSTSSNLKSFEELRTEQRRADHARAILEYLHSPEADNPVNLFLPTAE